MLLLSRLKRHPLPVSAHFVHSLVLTYALPREVLQPLLPPGLELDYYGDHGFLAIALVQTRKLRPSLLSPLVGQNFCLSGYRIFSRYQASTGRSGKTTELRGLRILRSDTNKRLMAFSGNLLTHYNYHVADFRFRANPGMLNIEIRSPGGEADLKVYADLTSIPASLPPGSPFPDLDSARHFAGPLPFTFDYEKETNSMIVIKGVRKKWDPQPVRVEVEKCTFFNRKDFRGITPVLANAFYVHDIPYRWEKGQLKPLRMSSNPV
jgi:hypothetical protein